jgi:hypothetical protein
MLTAFASQVDKYACETGASVAVLAFGGCHIPSGSVTASERMTEVAIESDRPLYVEDPAEAGQALGLPDLKAVCLKYTTGIVHV